MKSSSRTRSQRNPTAILHQKISACRAEADSLIEDLRIKVQNNETLVSLNKDLIDKNRRLMTINQEQTAKIKDLEDRLESLIFELET